MNGTEYPESTWHEFIQALYAPAGQDFDALYWIYRLTILLLDFIVPCRNHKQRQKLHVILRWFSPVFPVIGMTLVLFCGWSYFSIFRYTVVRPKWCGHSTTNEKNCRWEIIHGSMVVFLVINIIGHYLSCTFQSPGIVNVKLTNSHANMPSESNCSIRKSPDVIYHPSPNTTYCTKCELMRPARAHHCRRCNACILHYDHHCPWVNNCIGYNNYRSFVLLLVYIVAGCTYGVLMLGIAFYEMMKQRIDFYGWSIMGPEHGTGLLDLPLPWTLWNDYRDNGFVDQDVVLRAAFPLMFFVGIVMYWFLVYHVRIILAGFTTLEDMSRPHFDTVNPFDSGPRNNLKRALKGSWISLLIPLPNHSPVKKTELKKES